MLLNRAVTSIFPILITLSTSSSSYASPHPVKHAQDHETKISLHHADDVALQVRSDDTQILFIKKQDASSHDGGRGHDGSVWLRHIRKRRRRHHDELAEQQSAVIKTTQARSLDPVSRLINNYSTTVRPTVVDRPELVRQKRVLFNNSSINLSSDTHPHDAPNTTSIAASKANHQENNKTVVQSITATLQTPPMINASSSKADAQQPSYNLSNSTDPYAFSAESHSFALPFEIQILMCVLYGTLAFTAITSNMIVCYIVLSNQRMRTATNYFIVNLAVGDILMALLCIPFTFPANLVFQYWPFGLFLCVVVSYSQANSVFISAYTMVAISIDKYLAIMYPMRVRMTKTQAKNIILVIWSAALITSLPTAILSRLSPAFVDLSTADSVPVNSEGQAITTTMSSTVIGAGGTALEPNRTAAGSFTLTSLLETTTQMIGTQSTSSQRKQQEEEEEQFIAQNKYFCQESWTFWPKGKYYYSMALMVLQFVVPLFVLVITYSRIVIVVWGKKIPGEEDDARDARMARSKRKMIKMVILCVIAFALTWLPFNALIVIGDMRPDIWEHQNIMYIWFVTHYLAMCHTVTNPLIYIWMNNRFRAGFRQVISDLCKPTVHLFRYIWYHICCLGCVFKCSRGKYMQGVSRRELKRRSRNRQLSATMNQNHHQNNLGGNNRSGGGGGGFTTTTNTNNNNNLNTNTNTTATNNNNNNNNIDGHNKSKVNHRLDNNNGNNDNTTYSGNRTNNTTPTTTNNALDCSTYGAGSSGGVAAAAAAGSFGGTVDRPIGVSILEVCAESPSPGASCSVPVAGHSRATAGAITKRSGACDGEGEEETSLLGGNFDESTATRRADREIHNGPLGGRRHLSSVKRRRTTEDGGGGVKSVAASMRHKLRQFFFLWRHQGEIENSRDSNNLAALRPIGLATCDRETSRLAATAASIDDRISSSALLLSENPGESEGGGGRSHTRADGNNNNNDNDSKELLRQQQQRERKKKKRDKQSHVISIRMTAIDYYRKPSSGIAAGSGSLRQSRAPAASGAPACGPKGRITVKQEDEEAPSSFVGDKRMYATTNRKQSSTNSSCQAAAAAPEDDGSKKQLVQNQHCSSRSSATVHTKRLKLSIGRLILSSSSRNAAATAPGQQQHKAKNCPSCRAEVEALGAAFTSGGGSSRCSKDRVSPRAKDSVAKLRKKLASVASGAGVERRGKFLIDLHQSSQSTTPTTSTNQTNMTSLICSPADSSGRSSGNFAVAVPIGSTGDEPTGSHSDPAPRATVRGHQHQSAATVSRSIRSGAENELASERQDGSERRNQMSQEVEDQTTGEPRNVRSQQRTTAATNARQHYCSETYLPGERCERRQLLIGRSLDAGEWLDPCCDPRGALKSVSSGSARDFPLSRARSGTRPFGGAAIMDDDHPDRRQSERVLGAPPGRSQSGGRVHTVTNSNHSSYGISDAMINDLGVSERSRAGDVKIEMEPDVDRQGHHDSHGQLADHYCERHQLDQAAAAATNRQRLDDDDDETDEDVCDELLSASNQLTTNNKQQSTTQARHILDTGDSRANGCAFDVCLSGGGGGDQADDQEDDSEASNLLMEYGDLEEDDDDDDQIQSRGNTFRLARLNIASGRSGGAHEGHEEGEMEEEEERLSLVKNTGNNNMRTTVGPVTDTASEAIALVHNRAMSGSGSGDSGTKMIRNNATQTRRRGSNHLDVAHRANHLNRLFRSAGDNLLSEGQANGRQRLATRRARYRKLQSMANMVNSTTDDDYAETTTPKRTTTGMMTARLTQTNNGLDQRALSTKDSSSRQDAHQRQANITDYSHHRLNSSASETNSFSSGAFSGTTADWLMPFMVNKQTAIIPSPGIGASLRAHRLVCPDWRTECHCSRPRRWQNINQSTGVVAGGKDDGNQQRISRGCAVDLAAASLSSNSIEIKFRTETRPAAKAAASREAFEGNREYNHSARRRTNQIKKKQQQQPAISPANGKSEVAEWRRSGRYDQDDYDDKTEVRGLINGLQAKRKRGSIGDRLTGDHAQDFGPDSLRHQSSPRTDRLATKQPTSPASAASRSSNMALQTSKKRILSDEGQRDGRLAERLASSNMQASTARKDINLVSSLAKAHIDELIGSSCLPSLSREGPNILEPRTLSSADLANDDDGWLSKSSADLLAMPQCPGSEPTTNGVAKGESVFAPQSQTQGQRSSDCCLRAEAVVSANDEIDLQSCCQPTDSAVDAGTAAAALTAVAVVAAAAAAAAAAVQVVVADEKMPLPLSSATSSSSSRLAAIRKSPTVYMINSNNNSADASAARRQQQQERLFESATRPVLSQGVN